MKKIKKTLVAGVMAIALTGVLSVTPAENEQAECLILPMAIVCGLENVEDI